MNVDSTCVSAPRTPQQPRPPMTRTLSSELMDLSSAEDALVSPEVADCPSPRGSSLHGSTLSPAKDALVRLSGGSPSHLPRSSVRTVSSTPANEEGRTAKCELVFYSSPGGSPRCARRLDGRRLSRCSSNRTLSSLCAVFPTAIPLPFPSTDSSWVLTCARDGGDDIAVEGD